MVQGIKVVLMEICWQQQGSSSLHIKFGKFYQSSNTTDYGYLWHNILEENACVPYQLIIEKKLIASMKPH